MCLNLAAGPFGDAAIAAMSIVSRVGMFAGSALIGFGQGFQPVCGFNYGAQLYGARSQSLLVLHPCGDCCAPFDRRNRPLFMRRRLLRFFAMILR